MFCIFFMVRKGSGTSQTTGAFTSLVVNLLSVVLPRVLAFASASQMLVRQCGVWVDTELRAGEHCGLECVH